MGKWCDGMKPQTVPISDTPKRVTLVLPFYMNHGFFIDQLAQWANYPSDLSEHLSVIVVDDGSPLPLHKPQTDRIDLRLFRIEVDVRWNWLAARNIGAHHAQGGWLVMTDMDHVLPEATLLALVYGQHDPSLVYAFSRVEHTGEVISPHSASFFMTREMFWEIGGYDETLSGHYGSDGTYRAEIAKNAKVKLLADHLVRYEYVGDSSTTTYKRKQPEDRAVSRIVSARGKGWKPKVLSFPYHEVTL